MSIDSYVKKNNNNLRLLRPPTPRAYPFTQTCEGDGGLFNSGIIYRQIQRPERKEVRAHLQAEKGNTRSNTLR